MQQSTLCAPIRGFGHILQPALLVLVVFGLEACTTPPLRHTIAPSAREVAGGREVKVSVVQREIGTRIAPSRVAAAAGGGLLMALIDAGVNQHRAKAAESTAGDLRTELGEYDFDARALEVSKGVLAEVPWFGTAPTFSKEHTDVSMLADLDNAATSQVSFFDYHYGLSPDFSELEVSAAIDTALKVAPAGATAQQRTQLKNLVYTRRFVVVTALSSPSKDKSENAQRWSEEKAAFARRSIEASLAHLQVLMEKALLFTAEEEARFSGLKDNTQVGTRTGKLLEKSDAGTLLLALDGTWIYVVPEITS